MSLLGKPCPLCEGIGQLPESAVESLLRALADKLGYRLTAKPTEKPADPTDWRPVIASLSAARVDLGFGAAIYTGSAKQLRELKVGTPDEWMRAIRAQHESLDEALCRKRITRHQANTYLSLETISRNFTRCLQSAQSLPPPSLVKLSDGRWAEEHNGQRRILTDAEAASLVSED